MSDLDQGLADLFRLALKQHDSWIRFLARSASGVSSGGWSPDLRDLAEQWYAGFNDPPANLRPAGLQTLRFDIDREAEAADAQVLNLVHGQSARHIRSGPLRSLGTAVVKPGPRVSVDWKAGTGTVRVSLAGIRELPAGRYVAVIESDSGEVLGLVLVVRS